MTEAQPSAASGKIRRLAIGVSIFLVVYTGLWFLAAHQIQTRLPAFLSGRTGSMTAQCDGMDVRGFPFRIGLFCDTLKVDDTRMAASVSFGAMRSAAQVYWPGHAVVELDSPAELRVSPGLTASLTWDALRASVQATLGGLDRTSVVSDRITGTVTPAPEAGHIVFAADHAELHLRRNGPDLDAATSMQRFDLRPENGASLLPPMDAAIDLTVKDRANLMQHGGLAADALRGSAGEVRNLTLDFGDGMVTTASGPFTVSDEGLISGEFKVTMRDVEGWRRNLTTAFPDGRNLLQNMANMLTALSAGGNDSTVTLNVRDGTAFMAFIPIGVLPRL